MEYLFSHLWKYHNDKLAGIDGRELKNKAGHSLIYICYYPPLLQDEGANGREQLPAEIEIAFQKSSKSSYSIRLFSNQETKDELVLRAKNTILNLINF